MKATENVFLPKNYINGLTLSNNGSTSINVASGECSSDDGDYLLTLSATLTKNLASGWVAGNGNGGLDTGARAANSVYHVFLIRNLSTGAIDALFSLSPTAPTMPSGYTEKRRLGFILTDGSSNIRGFVQRGDNFTIVAPFISVDRNNGGEELDLNIFAYSPTIACRLIGSLQCVAVNSNTLGGGTIGDYGGGSIGASSRGVGAGGAFLYPAHAMGGHVSGSGSNQGDYGPTQFNVMASNGLARLHTFTIGSTNVYTIISIWGWIDYLRSA